MKHHEYIFYCHVFYENVLGDSWHYNNKQLLQFKIITYDQNYLWVTLTFI